MLRNPVFYPCFTCPKRGFLRQKSAEKMKKKAFYASKKPQNSPKHAYFRNMPNTLTHKLITTNHPICHPPRLENYFSAIFVSNPRKTPQKAPQTDPSRPSNRPLQTPKPPPLRDSKQHVSAPQQGSSFRPFEPLRSIGFSPPQMAHRQ